MCNKFGSGEPNDDTAGVWSDAGQPGDAFWEWEVLVARMMPALQQPSQSCMSDSFVHRAEAGLRMGRPKDLHSSNKGFSFLFNYSQQPHADFTKCPRTLPTTLVMFQNIPTTRESGRDDVFTREN